MEWLEDIRWDAQGLVPVIAQEVGSNDVLMFAYMNREALKRTAQTGQAVYWSRSRQRLWHKGESSGHFQRVHEIRMDCDNDVLLLKITQLGHEPGIACHTGRHSCFFQRLRRSGLAPRRAGAGRPGDDLPMSDKPSGNDTLARLAAVIDTRRQGDAQKSYVARLFSAGTDAMLKKVGEEATEVVMAGKDGDRQRVINEIADLWFHSMIVLAHFDLAPADVLAELERREGLSGLEEFAARKMQAREAGTT